MMESSRFKFRAWNGKKIFNIDVLAISSCTWDCPDHGKKGVSLAYQPSIKVMQYTGLKDKNGKEIYEGDVIQTIGTTIDDIGIVKFIDGSYLVEAFDGKDGWFLFQETEENEVIGNIYDNPGLIQKAD